MLSLVVSYQNQKSFYAFYLIHALKNAVVILEAGLRDFAFLNRFTDSAARIVIVFTVAVLASA